MSINRKTNDISVPHSSMTTNGDHTDFSSDSKPADKEDTDIAIYESASGHCEAPNNYEIYFKEGHVVKDSGWFSIYRPDAEPVIELNEFGHTEPYRNCILTPDQRERTRRIPGIARIVQFGDDAWLRSRKVRIHYNSVPRRRSPESEGYRVYIENDEYTVQEHFARIGRTFKHHETGPRAGGYSLLEEDLSPEDLADVFSDPNVMSITEYVAGSSPSANAETANLAPYEPALGDCEAPNNYVVYFKPGYTLEETGWFGRHRRRFEPVIATEPEEYQHLQEVARNTVLTPDQRERVRRMPGIAKVVQYGNDSWLRSRKAKSYVDEQRGIFRATGYSVMFVNREYTREEHFARIGQSFKHDNGDGVGSYSIELDLSAEELADVFSDPNVAVVGGRTTGGGRLH